MGKLDDWTDGRLAATLALAERIAGDLAVLVAGLRPDGEWWASRQKLTCRSRVWIAEGKTYDAALIAAVLAVFGKDGAA